MDVSAAGRCLWLAVALWLPSVGVAQMNPPRVVSINLCTDQLVMLLAEESQILALSALSRDEAGSFFHHEAGRFQQVQPVAEDIFSLAPDLVISGPYTSRYTLELLAELGIRVETLPVADSFESMLSNVQRVGQILQQTDAAAAIEMDVRTRLDVLQHRTRAIYRDSRPRLAVYDANGYTVGRNTMRGEAIELAGWENVASEEAIDTYGALGLERLIRLRPEALVESPYSEQTYSRAQMLAKHPAIQHAGLDPLIIRIPSNKTICAGPWSVDIVSTMVDARAGFLSSVPRLQ